MADDLRARRTPFALVGGLAVSARCEPRFTRDVDLAVAVSSDREAEALVRGLRDDRNRPQDRADLRQLLQTSSPEDLERVRSALTQIRERGFHRNRDLLGALDELLVE